MEQEAPNEALPVTPAAAPKFSITNVDAVRKAMLLTIKQMATLLGVSRVTYHNWLSGKPPRAARLGKVRNVMRKLSSVVTLHNWPTTEVIYATGEKRFEMLLELMKNLDEQIVSE